jgi:uncharacterized protein (DUF2141 family)
MRRPAIRAQMRPPNRNGASMSHKTLALWLIAGGIFIVPVAQAARVTVTVEGIRSTDGAIMVGLFDTPATFPQKFLKGESAVAQIPSVTLIFENVEPGRYAMSAFHDRNGNGKLDSGAFGIPKEPFGFSRDARAVMGPPSFEDAAFDVPAEGLSLVIHLK